MKALDAAEAGRALLEARVQPKLARLGAGRDPSWRAEIEDWLEQLRVADAPSALAVADHLDRLLDRLDTGGLRRWILGGLRRYEREPARQRAYFRLEDPRAVEALHGEASAESLWQALTALTWILAGLSAREVTVQPRHQAQLNAPELRPVLTSTHLLLPDSYTLLDGADRFGLFRAAVAHAAAHLLHSQPARDATTLKPMGIAVVSAIEDARVERLLWQDLPGVHGWFKAFAAPSPDVGDLGFAALITRMDRALLDPSCEDDNYWVQKARRLFDETEREAGLHDYDAFRRIASVLANDLGQMRVRFNPQQYAVPFPYRDDHSFLWDYGDPQTPPAAPTELDARRLDLHADRPDAPPEPSSAGEDVELGRYSVAEWDSALSLLRADWCTVVEERPASRLASRAAGPSADGLLPRLSRPWSRRLNRARRLRRQWEGDDIDLNAAIEVLIDRRLDLAPDARLFMRMGRARARSSLLVLLDLSESANDRVGGTMRSILDVEKEAAILLAASIDAATERIAVHGFSSDTRSKVRYLRLLDFGTSHDDPAALARIRGVQASLSTRMGAAMRRATEHVAAEPGEQRAIFVVTDGAPSDVDVSDADYLIEDARVAVQEARRRGVDVLCAAIDPDGDDYVRRIFGWRNYRIVDDPQSLPKQLTALCARWVAR